MCTQYTAQIEKQVYDYGLTVRVLFFSLAVVFSLFVWCVSFPFSELVSIGIAYIVISAIPKFALKPWNKFKYTSHRLIVCRVCLFFSLASLLLLFVRMQFMPSFLYKHIAFMCRSFFFSHSSEEREREDERELMSTPPNPAMLI